MENTTPKTDTRKPNTQNSVNLTYSINLPALQAGQSTRVEIWLLNTGSVRLTYYNNPSCYGTGVTAGNVTLDASGFADPSASAILTANGLSFKAHYQGDSNYDAADGLCTPISTNEYPDILSLGSNTVPQDDAVLSSSISKLIVQFNQDVLHGLPTDPDAADNPVNYLLVEAGVNTVFDTISCGGAGGGLQSDDTQVPINSVEYNPSMYTAEMEVNNGDRLPNGQYQLFVCGTTSIANPGRTVYLNNHLSDASIRFRIKEQNTHAGDVAVLPATGFPADRITMLPDQPLDKMYNQTGMEIEIPVLNIRKTVVGVSGPQWDISWLGDSIGYLQGTAFLTWNGNSVLTGHVANADGNSGPFANLSALKWGDRLNIHAWG